MDVVAPVALTFGPRYRYCHCWELPAADDASAIGFDTGATYFAKFAVTDQSPVPFGSQITPMRGLNESSVITNSPAWFFP